MVFLFLPTPTRAWTTHNTRTSEAPRRAYLLLLLLLLSFAARAPRGSLKNETHFEHWRVWRTLIKPHQEKRRDISVRDLNVSFFKIDDASPSHSRKGIVRASKREREGERRGISSRRSAVVMRVWSIVAAGVAYDIKSRIKSARRSSSATRARCPASESRGFFNTLAYTEIVWYVRATFLMNFYRVLILMLYVNFKRIQVKRIKVLIYQSMMPYFKFAFILDVSLPY